MPRLLIVLLTLLLSHRATAQGPPRLAPGPLSEADQIIQNCIDLTTEAGNGCMVESDTLSVVYPRASEELPTDQQTLNAISKMKVAAQPSASCCAGLAPFVAANCPCLPGFQELLPSGGLSPAYFEGATSILAKACRQNFLPCALSAAGGGNNRTGTGTATATGSQGSTQPVVQATNSP